MRGADADEHFMQRFSRTLAACVLASYLGAATGVLHAAEVAFALRIENGHLPENMRLIRIQRNDVVKLQWTSDRPMTIHLHGYDIEKQITPGTVTDMVFTARATGRFTVEPHLAREPSGGHAHGDVLVTIEVYP
jgi:hypothetical protein